MENGEGYLLSKFIPSPTREGGGVPNKSIIHHKNCWKMSDKFKKGRSNIPPIIVILLYRSSTFLSAKVSIKS